LSRTLRHRRRGCVRHADLGPLSASGLCAGEHRARPSQAGPPQWASASFVRLQARDSLALRAW
jgi:hypothetical protein